MGHQLIEMLEKGHAAFDRAEYVQASAQYGQVLAAVKKDVNQLRVLSEDNLHIVGEFCVCTRLSAKAALQNGRFAETEALYLEAGDTVSHFIANLNNRLLYRAFMLTQFKELFYELAALYASQQQTDKLSVYVCTRTSASADAVGEGTCNAASAGCGTKLIRENLFIHDEC